MKVFITYMNHQFESRDGTLSEMQQELIDLKLITIERWYVDKTEDVRKESGCGHWRIIIHNIIEVPA